jgi:hypothetical protein
VIRQEKEHTNVSLGSYQVESMSVFPYLGCYLMSNSDETETLKCGISVANKAYRAYFSLVPLVKTKDVI